MWTGHARAKAHPRATWPLFELVERKPAGPLTAQKQPSAACLPNCPLSTPFQTFRHHRAFTKSGQAVCWKGCRERR
jgi:hypothetical protein